MTANPTQITAARADPRKILVAIPTLNEERFIGATLDDLMAQAPQMRDVRIVVADGGSTDRTREMVAEAAKKYPNVSLIDNPGRLQAAGVNEVVTCCAEPQHEILVRVDAHARYKPGYVLRVADSLIEHDAAAVATVMDSIGDTCFQKGLAWVVGSKVGSGGAGHRGGRKSGYVDHGHHAGFDLAIFRAVDGYDTTFIANEDAELDFRIRDRGGRIWLDATIRMGYIVRESHSKLLRQYWRYGRGRAQTLRKHQIRPRLRQVIPPIAVVGSVLGLALAPIFPIALAVPGLYLLLVVVTTAYFTRKHRSACGLWGASSLISMHFAWGLGFLAELLLPLRR
ncbi:MAG: glycosyltransferase family 2 protein [Maritimibacter sp.]|nr:glycosyltransferase family 2 protein [Maritimibacter sp.]